MSSIRETIKEPLQQPKEYYGFLDGFRAVAILWVIFHHLLPYNKNFANLNFLHLIQTPLVRLGEIGFLGVDIFFVISGFLITGLLIDDLNDKIRVKRFYMRRILKIVPHYFLIVFFTYAFLPVISPTEKAGLASIFKYLFFWQNYTQPILPLAHLWSIAVEEHFYLIYPMVLVLICWITPYPQTRRKILLIILIILIVLGNYLRYLAFHGSTTLDIPPLLRQQSHVRFDNLIFGCMIKMIEPYLNQIHDNLKKIMAGGFCFVGLAFFTFLFINYKTDAWSHFSIAYTATGFLIMSGLMKFDPLVKFAENQKLRRIGKNSYGIYLWHYVIIHAEGFWRPLENIVFTTFPSLYLIPLPVISAFNIIVFTALSIYLGFLTTQTVERYFLNLRKKISP